ncbi:hypothetical protein PAESOLCIP111_01972 [Paenibacillus solanacearum]|uniref:DUF2634 domain-containing protein n=1 Tax=Paenibacillus solanacearum TaxID=2048548 RepID=A0A916NII7_9BACL|nr:DUF2634 domain-containing protein [Paenibacillus solanacearum]CAG7617023.1 hypothetical protein PAESOLCIP111_01972 [Paenibacillus solanacearum]
MIPRSSIDQFNVKLTQQPSLTYRLDPETQRIAGKIDRVDAVKQAAFKILQTARFEHAIYGSNYGSELQSMPGSSSSYIHSDLARRVREALMQDDRIKDIRDMEIVVNGSEAFVTFTVLSQYGNFQLTKEVGQDV